MQADLTNQINHNRFDRTILEFSVFTSDRLRQPIKYQSTSIYSNDQHDKYIKVNREK
jgi:hypothetical protein